MPYSAETSPIEHGPSARGPREIGTVGSFDDDANAIWYVRPPTGGQYGPASRDVVQAWLDEGRITPDSLMWREGWRDWKAAIEVIPEDAFPQLRIADAMPGLERILQEGGAMIGIPGGNAIGRAGRMSMRTRVFWGILAALGVGSLGAVYIWARYF